MTTTTSTVFNTCPPGTPYTTTIGKWPPNAMLFWPSSGVIANISSGGPTSCEVYSWTGELLFTINTPGAFSMPVSIAYEGNLPYVVQQTASSIAFTLA